MRNFRWYIDRMRAMSAAEIIHRVGEKWKRSQYANFRGWEAFDASRLSLPRVPAEIFDLKTPFTDEEIERWALVYERARKGAFCYLGQSWPEDKHNRRFRYDPASGRDWPTDRYCFDIPYRHTDTYGDVKYVWEINRLQYLQPIAILGYATNDRNARKFCVSEILDWCDQNPPFLGVAWSSGIELAIRALSILLVLPFVEDVMDEQSERQIKTCLNAHLFWIARYPSRFSSANNHLIAEAAALAIAGALWPDHPRSAEFLRYGKDTLEEEALRQIYPDGVGAEQSPTYHAFTLEFLLLSIKILEATGVKFAPHVAERIRASLDHLTWLMDTSGGVPRIGDDDEGVVIHDLMGGEERYVASIASAAAASLSFERLAPPAAPPHLRDRLFGRAVGGRDQPIGVKTFKAGGYTVFRDKVGSTPIVIVFDHGPLGYLSIAAHGHADALAFWVALGDLQIVVDSGTFGYHGANEKRDAMRATAAHNTVSVESQNQSLITGTFNWRNHAICSIISHPAPEDRIWTITAKHDGFLHRFGATHERTLSWNRDTHELMISDRVISSNKLASKGHIFLSSELHAVQKGVFTTISQEYNENGGIPLIFLDTPSELRRSQISNRFGKMQDTSRIAFSFSGEHSLAMHFGNSPPPPPNA